MKHFSKSIKSVHSLYQMDFSLVNDYFLKFNMRKYGAPANYTKTNMERRLTIRNKKSLIPV